MGCLQLYLLISFRKVPMNAFKRTRNLEQFVYMNPDLISTHSQSSSFRFPLRIEHSIRNEMSIRNHVNLDRHFTVQ